MKTIFRHNSKKIRWFIFFTLSHVGHDDDDYIAVIIDDIHQKDYFHCVIDVCVCVGISSQRAILYSKV